MCPDPDYTKLFGPFLIRRWGNRVRVDFRRSHERFHWGFGVRLPW